MKNFDDALRVMEHLCTVSRALCIGANKSHGSAVIVAARLLTQSIGVD